MAKVMSIFDLLLFPLVLSIHNLEEGLFLPKWSQETKFVNVKRVGEVEFRFALIIITLLAYLVSTIRVFNSENHLSNLLYFGFLGTMILNALIPHLSVSIMTKKYMPGLFSALFINLPSLSFMTYKAYRLEFITLKELIMATSVVSLLLLLLLPLLFKIGRSIEGFKDLK
jgi:hypothetical protein